MDDDPFRGKEAGNLAYNSGEYEASIALWRSALKNSLQQSVRHPSRELFEVGLDCRLNLAAAHVKLGQWEDVLGQLAVVADHRPTDVKLQFRRATALERLGQYDEALDALKIVLGQEPDNKAALGLIMETERQIVEAKKNEDKTLKKLFSVGTTIHDKRTVEDEPIEVVDGISLENLKSTQVIEWGAGDVDDPDNPDSVWSRGMMPEDARPKGLAFLLSLPLTILKTLEKLVDPTTQDLSLEHWDTLPAVEVSHLDKLERLSLVESLTRRANSSDGTRRVRRPTTIHIVGARGDVELQCMWTGILQRLPHVDVLQVVLIGFVDDDDEMGQKLKKNSLTPPLTKSSQLRAHQKLICYLYRGTYQEFLRLESKSTEFPPEDRSKCLLWDKKHKLHPDIVCIPEPLLNRNFDSYLPTFSILLESQKIIIFTGYSAIGQATNEGKNLPPILDALGVRWIMGPTPNPFRAKVRCSDGEPQLIHFDHYDNDNLPVFVPTGCAASAKHAIVMAVQGARAPGLYASHEVSAFKTSMRALGIDVDSAEGEVPIVRGQAVDVTEELRQKLNETLCGASPSE